MGVIDNAEDDLFGLTGLLILVAIIAIGVLTYAAAKSISIPDGAYPYPLFSRFATWVDGVFSGFPDSLKAFTEPFQKSADSWLGSVGNWINNDLPRSPGEKAALAADKQNSEGNSVGQDGTPTAEEAQVTMPDSVDSYDSYDTSANSAEEGGNNQ